MPRLGRGSINCLGEDGKRTPSLGSGWREVAWQPGVVSGRGDFGGVVQALTCASGEQYGDLVSVGLAGAAAARCGGGACRPQGRSHVGGSWRRQGSQRDELSSIVQTEGLFFVTAAALGRYSG